LAWANDDPEQRAAGAATRVADIAAGLTPGPALREVQGVGTVIARLAGAVGQVPVAMSNGIMAQVVDLAFNPAQPRDPKTGKWISGTGLISDAVKAAAPDLAGRSKASVKAHNTSSATAKATAARNAALRAAARSSARPEGTGPAADIGTIASNVQQQVAAGPHHATQADLDALEKRLNAQIEKADKQAAEIKKDMTEEHRAELGVEILSLVAGAALAFFSGHLGIGGGGEAGAALALGPYLVKTAIEKIPDVAQALSKYNVVGLGKGRQWIAHPVEKPKQAAMAGMRAVRPHVQSASQRVRTISSQVKVAAMRATPQRTRHAPPSTT
jgi:hypothetical protein